MRKIIFLIILWILSLILVTTLVWHYHPQKEVVVSDTVVVVNTVTKPVIRDSLITHFVTRTLPVVHDTCTIATTDTIRDSVRVEIPITRKTYQGEDYRAVVSGYEVNLDTISVISRTVTNTIIKKTPRFGIGPTVGYGMTNKGLSPYIGIGVYYNLFTF